MTLNIAGTWVLKFWRRFLEDGTIIFPFGEDAYGLLIYTEDGNMAVQMLTKDRPHLNTEDPIGGNVEERAVAYSSCLAYFGTYEVDDQTVIHNVEAALFPNWSDTLQKRPFVLQGDELSLQVVDDDGRLANEIVWTRKGSGH
jgi:hypothetical protein